VANYDGFHTLLGIPGASPGIVKVHYEGSATMPDSDVARGMVDAALESAFAAILAGCFGGVVTTDQVNISDHAIDFEDDVAFDEASFAE